MKKLILSVAAVFAFGFVSAQDSSDGNGGFAKGDLYLTGTANFFSEKTGDIKSDNFTVVPGVGYFVAENVAIEGSLGYTSATDVQFFGNDFFEVKNSGFIASAGVKYFWTPANKFSLFVGGNLSYASIKTEVAGFNDDFTNNIIGVNVPVGLQYFVSNRFAITSTWGGLGYTSSDNGGDGAEKTNGFDIGLDLSAINFGLLFKL